MSRHVFQRPYSAYQYIIILLHRHRLLLLVSPLNSVTSTSLLIIRSSYTPPPPTSSSLLIRLSYVYLIAHTHRLPLSLPFVLDAVAIIFHSFPSLIHAMPCSHISHVFHSLISPNNVHSVPQIFILYFFWLFLSHLSPIHTILNSHTRTHVPSLHAFQLPYSSHQREFRPSSYRPPPSLVPLVLNAVTSICQSSLSPIHNTGTSHTPPPPTLLAHLFILPVCMLYIILFFNLLPMVPLCFIGGT